MGGAGRGGARAAEERCPPPPQGLSCHQLLASTLQLCLPPLCPAPSGGVSTGRRHWKQPFRGFSGLAHCGGGARAAAPPSACYCPTAARVGDAGPQAESPPPELFFLGRVFSVLEATGCGERMMGLSLVPLHRPSFSRSRPVFSPQLWGLF